LAGAVVDGVVGRVALRAAVVLVVGCGRVAALAGRAVRLGAVVAGRGGWVVALVVVDAREAGVVAAGVVATGA
jgi:hypothetical protein